MGILRTTSESAVEEGATLVQQVGSAIFEGIFVIEFGRSPSG